MIHSMPGPEDIRRVELPNGIIILSRSNFNSPSLVVRGHLKTGALLDPDEKLGLANITTAGLMRGTANRTFQQIFDLLESSGASLNFGGGMHTSSFGGQCLVEDIDMLLALLGEALLQPAFPADQIHRLRSQMLAGLAIYAQDTGYQAQRAFDQIVYEGHPYSKPEEGLQETLQLITPEDLAGFHRQTYGPRGMLITIVGGIDPDLAVEKVARVLGGWQNSKQPDRPLLPALSKLNQSQQRKVTLQGKSQTDLVIGAAGPPRRSPDFAAANLGNNILGQFGLMGRLGKVVREDSGLAYYIQSNLSGGPGPGAWDISAGVDPNEVDFVIDLIKLELKRFTSELVTEEELADTQSNFIGSLPLTMESNHGVAASLLNLERYQLGLDYYLNYPGMIQSITRQDILEAAKKYLDPDHVAVGISGP